eukprot:3492085-Rhodomonas_salina.1
MCRGKAGALVGCWGADIGGDRGPDSLLTARQPHAAVCVAGPGDSPLPALRSPPADARVFQDVVV